MNPTQAKGFNLSLWAINHPALTRYLMVVLMVLGVAAYFSLGQDEDPPFTFRAMVVQAYWPGASALQMAEQVTDKIEKALQEAQRLDALGLLADAVGQAQALESAVLKLHTSWRRLGGLQERLWVESGSSTPHLRELLTALQSLSGSTLRVSLGELAGGKRVRLQLVEESPEQLPPPPLP